MAVKPIANRSCFYRNPNIFALFRSHSRIPIIRRKHGKNNLTAANPSGKKRQSTAHTVEAYTADIITANSQQMTAALLKFPEMLRRSSPVRSMMTATPTKNTSCTVVFELPFAAELHIAMSAVHAKHRFIPWTQRLGASDL